VIARLIESRLFGEVQNLDTLGDRFVEELSTFFSTYKRLRGQTYEVLKVGGPERAVDLIEEAADEFRRQLRKVRSIPA
jgi:inorganic pyrophosphatase